MPDTPSDVLYAFTIMGLTNLSAPALREAIMDARSSPHATKERIKTSEMIGRYLSARLSFGPLEASYADIHKAYHHKAVALHPDHTHGDTQAEEKLKGINEAFEMVESMERAARDHARKDASERQAIERAAWLARRQEAPPDSAELMTEESTSSHIHRTQTPPFQGSAFTSSAPSSGTRFFAASVPRSIRMARLEHLSPHAIIGSRWLPTSHGAAIVYDIIMLPEREFLRARYQLGTPGTMSRAYSPSTLTPVYVLRDAQHISIDINEKNPHQIAREHFIKIFGLSS